MYLVAERRAIAVVTCKFNLRRIATVCDQEFRFVPKSGTPKWNSFRESRIIAYLAGGARSGHCVTLLHFANWRHCMERCVYYVVEYVPDITRKDAVAIGVIVEKGTESREVQF